MMRSAISQSAKTSASSSVADGAVWCHVHQGEAVDLVESGLAARERERKQFLELADRLTRSKDPAEQARLKAELARLTFGD